MLTAYLVEIMNSCQRGFQGILSWCLVLSLVTLIASGSETESATRAEDCQGSPPEEVVT